MKLKGQCLRLEEELSISKQNHHEYQDYIASFEVQINNWDGPVFEKSPF